MRTFLISLILTLCSTTLFGQFEKLSTRQQYLNLLETWIPAAKQEIRFLNDDTAIYGLAQSGHWYMQAHDTAFCAFAVLGTDPLTDENRTGMTREEMRKTALAMLRYTLRSHLANGGVCTDGKPWGHTWISALGLERMSVGIDALDEYLPDDLRKMYANVCASEADNLVKTPVKAGLTSDNHPESNMWNGAICVRAAYLNPDHPNVEKWKNQASRLMANSISTPSDENTAEIVDGKAMREWFVGANMFDTFACNHHGYQNVGYMNITTSNCALLHFSCLYRKFTPPQALYHHAGELWRLEKTCLFPDGRLARVGGDTRIRYCYCQDYALLNWIFARNMWHDSDAESYERGWLRQVWTEQTSNLDLGGWFMGHRLANMRRLSPLYFLRLEGDKACSLAAGALWHRWEESGILTQGAENSEFTAALPSWHDPFHGAWCVRGEKRFACWTWHGAMKNGGLCVPLAASDMAEWNENLAGQIWGVGMRNYAAPLTWTGSLFPGGFATCGLSQILSTYGLAEGADNSKVAKKYQATVALPDDATLVVFQKAFVENEVYLRRVRALNLMIPADVFNDFKRRITSESFENRGVSSRAGFQTGGAGKWLNIDGKLGVIEIYGNATGLEWVLPEDPQVEMGLYSQGMKAGGGFLHCMEVVQAREDQTVFYPRDSVLFETAAALVVGDANATKALAECVNRVENLPSDSELVAVSLPGQDGAWYFVLANFAQESYSVSQVQLETWAGGALEPISDVLPENFPANGVGVWKITKKSGKNP